ncbi:Receptor-like protein kinase [Senna tora]|uniref:Receptor-like protein kinase n=1 Tax=Senna tora TaxID=362788 RepID=A0A834TYC1_9FABA|nr:Receptor-like protein kinase [Senna tora]
MGSSPAEHSSSYTHMKDLMALHPWNTPPPPLYKNHIGQYVKVKHPLYHNGKRVYWRPKITHTQIDADSQYQVPYEGFFEFCDRHVINTIRHWFDKCFGQIFSLPRPAYECHYN